ncbi:MAG: DUF2218 domain-containing protein [Pseudomonadota bacterium]
MQSSAQFETTQARRFLEALCMHFGEKVEARCSASKGWVRFPFGRCDMRARSDRLEMVASAENADALDQIEQIVTSHLERYAFRENPRLNWQSVAAPQATETGD